MKLRIHAMEEEGNWVNVLGPAKDPHSKSSGRDLHSQPPCNWESLGFQKGTAGLLLGGF